MSIQERLENLTVVGHDGHGNLLVSGEDWGWLLDQAERVQKLEENAQDLRDALGSRQEENARLREALEFYADHSNWNEENTGSPYLPYYESNASGDGGDKARKALGHPE